MVTAFKNAAAFATYKDIWAGDMKAALVPFKTKRNGQSVIRFRWITERGSVGIWASPFQSEKGGITAASRHPDFANISAA